MERLLQPDERTQRVCADESRVAVQNMVRLLWPDKRANSNAIIHRTDNHNIRVSGMRKRHGRNSRRAVEHDSISEYHVIREHFYRMHRLVKLRRYPGRVEGAMKFRRAADAEK